MISFSLCFCAETTHQIVVEAGTVEVLEGMLEHLLIEDTDRKEKELVVRALTALEPDGWRGVDHGLRDEVRRRRLSTTAWIQRP